MLFTKYSRGYKSGGLNTGTIVARPLTDSEFVDSFELGVKQQIGGQLQINAAVFYYDYDGMQIPLSVNPLAGPPITQYINMDVISRGFELETVWQVTDAFQVLFNYALLNPIVKRGDTSCCFVDNTDPRGLQAEATPTRVANNGDILQDLTGARVPQSPKHKAAVNLNYTFELGDSRLIVSATDTWKDKTYFSIFNRWYNEAPSYHQVDLRLTWKLLDDKFDVVAFGRNVLDDEGYDGTTGVRQTQLPLGSASAGGANVPVIPAGIAQSVSLTPPRTYGLEVRYKF
jgi:iron complex outermembrane receptor protein